jgi:hypothetical protein
MRKVYVLLGVLVALGLVAWFVNYDPTGKGADRAPAVEPVDTRPPAVDPSRVQAIEVSDPENRIRVARSGDKWVLPEKFNAPAIDKRPTDLLKALQGLEKAHRVSRSAASARDKAFGLEPESAKRVKLFDDNNKIIADVWIGKPDMGGDRTVQLAGNFVRVEGSDAVYSHKERLQHLVMPQLSMWLEGRLFPLESKDLEEVVAKVERVSVEFDDVPATPPGTPESQPDTRAAPPRVRLVLEGKDVEPAPESAPADVGPKPNTPPKPPARKTKDWTLLEPSETDAKPYAPFVDQIVRSFMYGRADDVVGSDPTLAEYGFERPAVEVEARFSDGTIRRLRIGAKAPPPTEPTRRAGSYRFGVVDGIPRVFLVNEMSLAAYRKKPADLKQPDAGRGAPPGVQQPIELPKDEPETRR